VVGLVWSNDPKSYAGGSTATGRAFHARQVKGDDPDKRGCPGPPGWGPGVGLTTSSRKRSIVSKPHDMPRIRERNRVRRRLWQRQMDMNLGTWNVRSLYKPGGIKAVIPQLQQHKIHTAAIQETRWHGKAIMGTNTRTVLHSSKEEGTHEQGVAFIVHNIVKNSILDYRATNERICTLRAKTRFFNLTLINAHAPTEDKDSEYKEEFYQMLQKAYVQEPSNDIKIIIGELNAQTGQEKIFLGRL
jgi:hypothetical protein